MNENKWKWKICEYCGRLIITNVFRMNLEKCSLSSESRNNGLNL